LLPHVITLSLALFEKRLRISRPTVLYLSQLSLILVLAVLEVRCNLLRWRFMDVMDCQGPCLPGIHFDVSSCLPATTTSTQPSLCIQEIHGSVLVRSRSLIHRRCEGSRLLLNPQLNVPISNRPRSQNPTSFVNPFRIRSRRSGRVVKAFDSNDLYSTSSAIKSFRGQEFESLGRRHLFDVFLLSLLLVFVGLALGGAEWRMTWLEYDVIEYLVSRSDAVCFALYLHSSSIMSEIWKPSKMTGGVVATVYTGDSASRNIVSGSGDVANTALVLVRARGRGDGRNGTLVRVVADVRSVTVVGKTLLLDDRGVGTDGGVARVSGVVRRTDGVANGKRVGVSANNTLLSVVVGGNNSLGLADEEATSGSSTGGVVVGRARAESLLLLVVLHEDELHDGSDKEENSTGNGNSEDSLVKLASGAEAGVVVVSTLSEGNGVASRSVTERSLDIVAAALGSLAGQDGNGNHATHAENIEEQTKGGQESDTSQAAGQECSANGVQSNDTSDTLNCLPLGGDIEVVVCKDSQEVTEDADDDGGTAEAECIESSLQQTEGASLEDTHGD
ncbi:hypothetical protein KCU62_g377, partial [Aureobasidium sp. EXF-3399]